MNQYTVIGILAHVDAGKTTLSEALLFQAGVIRKQGRVDHKDAFLDTNPLERERGITIFSKQAILPLPEKTITLLDTPGHVDFSAETERTLQVLDAAILVISGLDGVQSHTETLWQLLQQYHIPTFLFLNKMDLSPYSEEELLIQLQENYRRTAFLSHRKMQPFMNPLLLQRKPVCNSIWKQSRFRMTCFALPLQTAPCSPVGLALL